MAENADFSNKACRSSNQEIYRIIMFRTLSPSGAPIRLRDLVNGLKSELFQSNSLAGFQKQLIDYFGVEFVYLISSGKAALCETLKAIMSVSDRREVIIPAYSSFCLASAVAKAGVAVKLCDIDPDYLDFNLIHLEQLVTNETLAILPVHLFGLVARLDPIIDIAASKGAFVIEDAAQAAGSIYNGKKVGTLGDAAIFSLGRGKNISTIEGGFILAKNEKINEALFRNLHFSTPTSWKKLWITGLAICFLLNPYLYFLPNFLPFVNLGANVYDPDFDVSSFSPMLAGVGESIFCQLDQYNERRRINAQILSSELFDLNFINLPRIIENSLPSFTRFPFVCHDVEIRESLFDRLNNARLGVSKNFPYPLNEITEFRPYILNKNDNFIQSKKISETLLTIPTHPYVTERDLERMIQIIRHNLFIHPEPIYALNFC